MTTVAADSSGITFRRAVRADLLEISRIERASFPQPWPFYAFQGFLDEPGFLVAVADGAGPTSSPPKVTGPVIGYIVADTVHGTRRPIGHIKDLAVEPKWRGQGVGARLVDRGLGVLAAEGAQRAKLEVRRSNAEAISLYERFGFALHHVVPKYYDDGEDALVLVADLSGR